MLETLYVKNLAIIDELEVSFGRGLNILTGETGAGKSVIIGSINLALGGKTVKNILRDETSKGIVELIFSINELEREKLERLDVYIEDDIVAISRKISKDRSIFRINGEVTTLTKIREVASMLLDIHGQMENQTLLLPKNHLEILDRYRFNKVSDLRNSIKAWVEEYKKIEFELKKKDIDDVSKNRELEFLKYECGEIERAKLVENEEEELSNSVKKYSEMNKIMELSSEILQELDSYDGIRERITNLVRLSIKLEGIDSGAGDICKEAVELEGAISEFRATVNEYSSLNNFDEANFSNMEYRLNKIRNIYMKHGGTYEKTIRFYNESISRIEELENLKADKERLIDRLKKLKTEILSKCGKLSKIRTEIAGELSEKINLALRDLNFRQAEFNIRIEKEENFGIRGNDRVIFEISTNQGEKLRPIHEIASGGELSRIMLAIKSVLSDTDNIDTLIFDEIDTGISGRTAQMVAEKMSLISKKRQVIAITHLAQIAAMADGHYLIEKLETSAHTHTTIKELTEKESVEEIARILGGVSITESVLHSAEEMKKLASEIKNK